MADVTGPISTMPGALHGVPDGTMCDEHPDRPATARIQGPADSFGCEMSDCCDECAKVMISEARTPSVGKCDWCSTENVDLRDQRDYDEGMCGPLYQVCQPCRDRYAKALADECASYDNGRDDWDD